MSSTHSTDPFRQKVVGNGPDNIGESPWSLVTCSWSPLSPACPGLTPRHSRRRSSCGDAPACGAPPPGGAGGKPKHGNRRLRGVTAGGPDQTPARQWNLGAIASSGDASEFAQIALRFEVVVTPGTVMSVDDSHHRYLRLPFLLAPDVLTKGIQRLAQAWDVYRQLAREKNAAINGTI